ncbi:hypothetical protein Bbelb_388620 [Branchiostoma belcheri]|nr:hypothetical protein Bbelb_388620 [Branchiostoma belcheri]
MVVEGRGATVGKLVPHAEVKIADKDGQVVPLDQEGEVYVRGYSLFKRYRSDEEKTAKAMTADGWYKTGTASVPLCDTACRCPELSPEALPIMLIHAPSTEQDKTPVSRTVSGANLRSGTRGDVRERYLTAHSPGHTRALYRSVMGEDPSRGLVVGVPDPASVEEICACIILKQGQTTDSEEMTEFCAEIGGGYTGYTDTDTAMVGVWVSSSSGWGFLVPDPLPPVRFIHHGAGQLAPIETPRYFLYMEKFPMTSTQNKVDRKKLRLVAMEKLSLEEA